MEKGEDMERVEVDGKKVERMMKVGWERDRR